MICTHLLLSHFTGGKENQLIICPLKHYPPVKRNFLESSENANCRLVKVPYIKRHDSP